MIKTYHDSLNTYHSLYGFVSFARNHGGAGLYNFRQNHLSCFWWELATSAEQAGNAFRGHANTVLQSNGQCGQSL